MKLIFQNKNISIYNSVFEYIDSNMYIIIENNKALIIDPHQNNEVYNLLRMNGIIEITVLLTHEHPDHISGLKWLKDNFNTTIISTKETSDYISDIKNTRPILITFVLEEKDKQNGTNLLEKFKQNYEPFATKADITFEDDFEYKWNSHSLKFKKVLGHSKGSCLIFLDNKIVFSGDSLMKDYPIITRFPRGNNKIFKNETIPYLETLNMDLEVFPGHGKIFKLKDIFSEGKLHVELK